MLIQRFPNVHFPNLKCSSALEKHPCPACGAQAEWNPGKQKLVCPFCGTESPYQVTATGEIEELDLVRALREMPEDQRGWQTEKRTVQCRSCKAVSVFDPERVGQRCEFCGSPEIVDYEEIKAPIRPQSLLPFRVAEPAVREQIRRWYKSKWLAPGIAQVTRAGRHRPRRLHSILDLRRAGRVPVGSRRGPLLLHDRDLSRQQGEHADAPGAARPLGARLGRRRALLRRRAGSRDAGDLACAAASRSSRFRRRSWWPTTRSYLSGFVVEHYQIVLLDAATASEESMHQKLEEMCAAQVPGDTHRNLEIHPTFSSRTFKHILVPVWLLTYTYGARIFHVLVNGVDRADGR